MHPPDTMPYSLISNPTPTTYLRRSAPELGKMGTKILDDLPDIINVPEELLSDFDSWAHSMLEYQW